MKIDGVECRNTAPVCFVAEWTGSRLHSGPLYVVRALEKGYEHLGVAYCKSCFEGATSEPLNRRAIAEVAARALRESA